MMRVGEQTNLAFIAHGDLHKTHGMALIRLLDVVGLKRRIPRYGFDALAPNVRTSKTQDEAISGLDEEQPDAKICQPL